MVLLEVPISPCFYTPFIVVVHPAPSPLILGNHHIRSKFITHHSNSNSISVSAFVSVDKQLNKMRPQDPVASCKIFPQQCVPLHVRPLNPILSSLNSSPTIHAAQNQNYHEITQSLRWRIGKRSCNICKKKISAPLHKLNSSDSVTGVGDNKNAKP